MKLLGKILSTFLCAVAVWMIIGIALMFILGKDGDISNIVWTKEALEEYNAYPDDFTVEYYSEYEEHYLTEDGYFSVSKIRYIPAVSQWQMTVRYNKSTLKNLSEDYDITLENGKDHFTFFLKDDDGNIYKDFRYLKETKKVWGVLGMKEYTYYRLVFDDVDIMDAAEIKLYICFKDKTDDKPLGELPVYYSEMERDLYKFKKELPEDMEPTKGLKNASELLG